MIAAFLLFEVTAASGKIPAQQIGRALLPGFVAAGTGAVVFTGVAGWDGLHQTNLALPSLPPYETLRLTDLAWCLLMAGVIAIVVVGIRHLAHGIAVQSTLSPAALLVVAGIAVGALAVAFRATADRPVDLVLFSGQAELPDVVAEGSAWVLVLLVAAKGLAYALSLGAGYRGGPVFPAIAIGVAAAMFAADVLPGLHTTPAVAAGIAAGTTAVLRVPFTAVLLVSLLMGASAFDVAPIAVLAAAVAWLVATVLPNPEDRLQEKLVEGAPPAPRELLRLGFQLVADAVPRVDEGVARRAPVHLLAELADEDVDGPVAMRRAASPDALEQLVTGEHAALLTGERVQEPELRRCQLGALPVDVRLDVVGVEAKLLDQDRVAAPGLGLADAAPRCRAHARRELLHREGLHQVVVGADLERVHSVVLGATRGDDDDRRADPLVARLLDHAPAVDAGKHEVEDADVRALVAQAGQAGLAVGDADGIEPRRLEVSRHPTCDDVVVFDDQDFRHPATP